MQERSKLTGDLLTDRQSLEPIDAALTLFDIDRIARQIPVNDLTAVEMEVQPLLSYRGRGERECLRRTTARS